MIKNPDSTESPPFLSVSWRDKQKINAHIRVRRKGSISLPENRMISCKSLYHSYEAMPGIRSSVNLSAMGRVESS